MKIYEPKGRAREYSPLALNYFKGCTHNCAYCYVNRLNSAFGRGCTQSEVTPPSESGFVELEKSAKFWKGCNKQILLQFVSDPYCDIDSGYTERVLSILNKHEHKVAILTKGGLNVLDHLQMFEKFGNRIKVGATLTFDNDVDSLIWEPGASVPKDRISMLKQLASAGIKTWVSFEPVIIPNQSLNLLSIVSEFVDHVKIGKLNDYKWIDKNVDWAAFLCDAVKICRESDLSFYIKNDLAIYSYENLLSNKERDSDFLNL